MNQRISIVIPAYNEASGIAHFYKSLRHALPKKHDYEIIFVNDGSKDDTLSSLLALQDKDSQVRVLSFSRNFGKEAATTAGITHSKGDAVIIIDADGQHPVELIDSFLQAWQEGSKVVIGIRQENQKEGFVKKYGSKLFYKLFNLIADGALIPGSTDFRLIDSSVKDEFSRLKEKSRITRALIDWLGYEKKYIYFTANPREHGEATYTTSKLIKLAFNSFISLTTFPLYVTGYLGVLIVILASLSGLFVIVEQYVMNDPLGLNITGTATLGIFIVFLVGIILACQGLIAMYISRIYEEVKDRPLYVIESDTDISEK